MKKSISKLLCCMLLVFSVVFLFPGIVNAANLSGTGSGTSTDPYIINVGNVGNATFTYTTSEKSGTIYQASLKLIITDDVSLTFSNDGNHAMTFRRETKYVKKTYDSSKSLIARKGDTILLYINSASKGTNTLTITSKAITISEDVFCEKDPYYCTHSFEKGHSSECLNNCGYVCKHPKSAREYESSYHSYKAGTHLKYFTCNICQEISLEDSNDAVACTVKKWTSSDAYNGKHQGTCTVCNGTVTGNCSFTVKVYKKTSWCQHQVTTKCKVCQATQLNNTKNASHTFRNNVCTLCKFKRIVPGSTKVTSAKQKGKMKKSKINVQGHWTKNAWNQWVWQRPYSYYNYKYPITMKLKKSTNAKKYVVSIKYNNTSMDLYQSTKTSFKFTYISSKKQPKKVTLYVTPYSSTGTPGKTTKVTVKLHK